VTASSHHMNADAPHSQRESVAIVIVNWNNWRDCVECLDTVLALSHRDFHIFLVDNDSADGSVERIAEWCQRPRSDAQWRRHTGIVRLTDDVVLSRQGVQYAVNDRPAGPLAVGGESGRLTLIRSGANLGYAGGCNVGILAAGTERFDYFWFLNSDTVVHGDALSALLARARRQRSVGMVGSTLRFYDRPDTVQAMGGSNLDMRTMSAAHIGAGRGVEQVPQHGSDVEDQLVYIFGASMLVSSVFIRDIGPMQEDYFLYYEEFDWALRGRGRYSLGYAPDSHVFHKSGASSYKVMPEFSARYYYRNRIRFFSRFFPAHIAAVKRGLVADLMRRILHGELRIARVVARVLWDARSLTHQTAANGSADICR
jgi:GT2 family glycosyltransferase